MSIISQFHFIRPLWLLALIPLIYILYLLYKNKQTKTNWQHACDPHLLPYMLKGKSVQKVGYLILLGCAWLLTIFILAGPSWTRLPEQLFSTSSARVYVFDLSANMLAQDILPSRLTRARFKLLDFLKTQPEGQSGLVVFAGEPYTVSPLTQDSKTIASMVPSLTPEIIPLQGANLAQGLNMAGKLLTQAGFKKGQIIVISATSAGDDAIHAAEKLRDKGYKSSVLGIGTIHGAPLKLEDGQFYKDQQGTILISKLNPNSLRALAKAGGGKYVNFTNTSEDIQLFNQINQSNHNILHKKSAITAITNRWQDDGIYFIWALVILALCAFRRGWFEELTR